MGAMPWGNRMRFRLQPSSHGAEYLLVSFGADGKCDVANIDLYFAVSGARIDGPPDRDIVFRTGEPLMNAGK